MKTTPMTLLIVIAVQTHRSSGNNGSLMNRESHATHMQQLLSSQAFHICTTHVTSKHTLCTRRVESNFPSLKQLQSKLALKPYSISL